MNIIDPLQIHLKKNLLFHARTQGKGLMGIQIKEYLVQFLVAEAVVQLLQIVISNYTMMAQTQFILLLKDKQGKGI